MTRYILVYFHPSVTVPILCVLVYLVKFIVYPIPQYQTLLTITNQFEIRYQLRKKKTVIIGTDQNLDYLQIMKHKLTEEFFEVNILNELIPTILLPTRVNHTTKTLIDNIHFKDTKHVPYSTGVLLSDTLQDH